MRPRLEVVADHDGCPRLAVHSDREARATVVIGDDLQPGAHELSFAASPSTPVWVHLPWVHQGAPQIRESAWIAGGFP